MHVYHLIECRMRTATRTKGARVVLFSHLHRQTKFLPSDGRAPEVQATEYLEHRQFQPIATAATASGAGVLCLDFKELL